MADQSENVKLQSIHIYNGSYNRNLNVSELAAYLHALLPGTTVHLHKEFIHSHTAIDERESESNFVKTLAAKFAGIKVIDPRQRKRAAPPLTGEVEYETRRLLNTEQHPWGILYDAEQLLEIYNALLPPDEKDMHALHLAVTNQLFGTWDAGDVRYHARSSIYSIPCIISTTGLVEAPAKPRRYYQSRQMGVSHESLENQLQGQFLIHDDTRITEVIKGYVMQAVFYLLEGDPFCTDHNCRLYNAHWQHELLHAQLHAPYEFCPRHTARLHSI